MGRFGAFVGACSRACSGGCTGTRLAAVLAAGKGAAQSLGVMAAVVAFGLAWARAEAAVDSAPPPYPGGVLDHRLRVGPPPSQWLVDGFNLLHAVLLGGRDRSEWWTEPRRGEVLALAAGFDRGDADLFVVFDGPPERCGEAVVAGGVREVFTESADDWLVARVRASERPSQVAVVTADRPLVRRLERCGARVVPPEEFAVRCRSEAAAGRDD